MGNIKKTQAAKVQWIDMKQDFRVVLNHEIVFHATSVDQALNHAATLDGDPDVEQLVEFGQFGKYPEQNWVSVFKLEELLSS